MFLRKIIFLTLYLSITVYAKSNNISDLYKEKQELIAVKDELMNFMR